MKFIPENVYLDFLELVLKMMAAGEKVIGYAFDGYWMDLAARMIMPACGNVTLPLYPTLLDDSIKFVVESVRTSLVHATRVST